MPLKSIKQTKQNNDISKKIEKLIMTERSHNNNEIWVEKLSYRWNVLREYDFPCGNCLIAS